MLTKRQERALIRQNANECADHAQSPPQNRKYALLQAMTIARITDKEKWDYYTAKLLLLLEPVRKTRGSMQLIWARHASEIMKIRDKYREVVG